MAHPWSLLVRGFESLLIHKINKLVVLHDYEIPLSKYASRVKTDVMKNACSQLFRGFIKSVPFSIFRGKKMFLILSFILHWISGFYYAVLKQLYTNFFSCAYDFLSVWFLHITYIRLNTRKVCMILSVFKCFERDFSP